jgi:hypothetical protein
MAGSGESGTSTDLGNVIRFPLSGWVPPDGLEPLSLGEQPSLPETEPEPSEEVDGFWGGEGSQAFLLGAPEAEPREAAPSVGARTTGTQSRHAWIAVGAVAGVCALGAALAELVLGSEATHQPTLASSASVDKLAETTTTLRRGELLRRERPVPRPGDHPRGSARRHRSPRQALHKHFKTVETSYASSSAGNPPVSTPTYTPVSTAPPTQSTSSTYSQPAPSTAMAAAASSQPTRAGPTGPGALTGAGSTPSG